MAHQVPHPAPVQEDDDVENSSSSGLGKSPLTLSFINNVQSAVAQIEHRLAASPSAHPPPQSPHEIPPAQVASTDPATDRTQFLETSLSIPSPRTSKPVSLSDSTFAGAINSDASLVSSGVIISTTPPNTSSPDPCDTSENHTSPPQPQTSSISVSDTADGRINGPVSTIAPIVEQFETPVTPSFTKEQQSAIVTAPIAPIVEHFEASSQPVRKTDKTQTIEASGETLAEPISEQPEASIADSKPVSSSNTESSDTALELKANTCDSNQVSSGTDYNRVEHKVSTVCDISAGVPTASRPEQENATNQAVLKALLNTDKPVQSMSTAAESTLVRVVDKAGDVGRDAEQASKSNEKASDTDTTSTSAVISPEDGESKRIETGSSCDIDQGSQSRAHAPAEETSGYEENTEVLRERKILGDPSETTCSDRTQQEGEAHLPYINHEIVDVAELSVRPGKKDEQQLSSDGNNNSMPSEADASAVMKPSAANITAAASSQADGEAGASSTQVSISNTPDGELETPENPPSYGTVKPESLKVVAHSSGNEFKDNDGTLSTEFNVTDGDTSATEKRGKSDNRMGTPENIAKLSQDDVHTAPAIDTVNKDKSRVADTETLVGEASAVEESGREQESSYKHKGNHDLAPASEPSSGADRCSRSVLGTASRESANPGVSHGGELPRELAKAKPCETRKIQENVATEARNFEENGRPDEGTTDIQSSEQLSREGKNVTGIEDETAVGTNGTVASSIQREASTQTFPKGHHGTSEQETLEVMAAKAVLARDKLAKFSLGSSVKKPHRGQFIRKTGDTRESFAKTAGSAPVSPGTRRSPTGPVPNKSSISRTELATRSDMSPTLSTPETSCDSQKESKLPSLSASSRGTDSVITGLPPRRSPIQKGRSPLSRQNKTIGYTRSEKIQERNVFRSEQHSPLQISQSSSDNIPRLPRVAELTRGRTGSSRTPHSAPKLRTRARIPKAATFSATVPRSKPMVSSPVLGRKVGIESSPVTPSSPEKGSNTRRPPLRRALSFLQSKPANTRTSPLSRPASSRSRGSDTGSTLSLSASGSKPPRGVRPRFTIPEPFALTGPELQEKSEKQMEEVRRKAAEADLRPRVFKPRPMPDFSRPYPKPHK